jgi:hypothetical protein
MDGSWLLAVSATTSVLRADSDALDLLPLAVGE